MLSSSPNEGVATQDACPVCDHSGRFHHLEGCIVVRCHCWLRSDQMPEPSSRGPASAVNATTSSNAPVFGTTRS